MLDEDKLVKSYKKGNGVSFLMRAYGVSEKTIHRILEEHGCSRKEKPDFFKLKAEVYFSQRCRTCGKTRRALRREGIYFKQGKICPYCKA